MNRINAIKLTNMYCSRGSYGHYMELQTHERAESLKGLGVHRPSSEPRDGWSQRAESARELTRGSPLRPPLEQTM